MTEQAQRIAIAKWTGLNMSYVEFALEHFKDRDGYPDAIFTLAHVPDYTRDLSAIHSAVMHIDAEDESRMLDYVRCLQEDVCRKLGKYEGLIAVCNASAAQRAEALLRTLNLWVDDTPSPT